MLRVGDKVEVINQDGIDTLQSVIGRVATIYDVEWMHGAWYYWIGFNTRNYGLRAFEAWQLKKI
jgi:hypothetical protein